MAQEQFRTRFGLIVALIGMAVGTGNIWRFPRVMAANGGGAFLIAWLFFLFLWSIPLLIVEFSLGQKLRRGVVGCFSHLTHGKLAWLGGFVVWCTLGIMFYYSVVTGWCLFYFFGAATGEIFTTDSALIWSRFTESGWQPLLCHGIVVFLVMMTLLRGVQKGIEAMSVFMIPALFLILIGLSVYAMTLSGRSQALEFIFNTNFLKLLHYRVWLEALTQSAWSTGAGWGLALSYACYARKSDHPVLTPFTTGFGNNSIELLAAITILVPLFSFFSMTEIMDLTGKGNTGLTFVALPGLFEKMPGGRLVAIFFFVALFFAAFTSLAAMFEMGVRYLGDLGWKRRGSVLFLGVLCFAIGSPSALRMSFFENQDWVWGVGLLVSGFFFSILMHKVGIERFSAEYGFIRSYFHRKILSMIILVLVPIQFAALIGWWFYQSIKWDPEHWWNPFHSLTIGTCLLQWSLLLIVLWLFNPKTVNRIRMAS